MVFKFSKIKFTSGAKFMVLAIIITAYLANALYYGSFYSTCTFTEEEVEMPTFLKNASIKLIKEATIVTGREPERECLDILGKVNKEFSEVQYENYSRYMDPKRTITRVSPSQNLIFKPYKMIWQRTRGLRWALGGSGKIYTLLLKDSQNETIEIALVSLGMNKGDEFLKAVNGSEEYILNHDLFEKIGNLKE